MCECEAVVNARPLTYISDDPNDLTALTPAMFLRAQEEVGTHDIDEIDRNSLIRSARNQQRLREHLRRRFRLEYLGQLKVFVKKTANLPIKLGEIVLVENDNLKRVEWPMGRVIELIPAPDGYTRLVRIKTVRGELLRAMQRLFPLECTSKTPPTDNACIVEEDSGISGPINPQQEVLPGRRYRAHQGDAESDDSAGVYKSRVPVQNVRFTRSGREIKIPTRYIDQYS
ncbi:uncharacterized protein LOC108915713 [Anoplophora glabripennis]|uniref:uncharacterized protein LOC108915713 n=1 Tax=Anoplophora glabripennis TaxID=217634 RepID=UPI0008735BF9|nr:uncharacterized protein LOC108915713 [Anoplophora glabripennis]